MRWMRGNSLGPLCPENRNDSPPSSCCGIEKAERTIINCSRNILPPEGKVKDAAVIQVPLNAN